LDSNVNWDDLICICGFHVTNLIGVNCNNAILQASTVVAPSSERQIRFGLRLRAGISAGACMDVQGCVDALLTTGRTFTKESRAIRDNCC
jgi:hypothetical protein